MAERSRGEATPPFLLLAACFFGSGLTGLTYEILWMRRLQLTFGSTTYSVTTVLCAFMAGLGLGSYLIGRRADRSGTSGARLYAYLELAIGLYALISLPLLALVERIYALLQGWLALGQGGAVVLKLLLAFPVLALPAGLMGGTLPVLVRALLRRRASLHAEVSRLYGINTIGAALGTALTGMLLIEHLGLWHSMVVAAAINLSIGGLVLTHLARSRGSEGSPPSTAETAVEGPAEVKLREHLRSPPVLFAAVAVTLTGLLSMLYEIVWTRLLATVLGSSTYAFTIVLAIFLTGIALGALIYARRAHHRPPEAFTLALLLLGLALWVAASISAIPALPELLIRLGQIPGFGFSRLLCFQVAFAALLLLVPTLILGAALPLAMGIIARAMGQVGRDVGGVYLANTLGAIGGSLLTGFLLIPLLGCQRTLLVGVVLNLALAGAGLLRFGNSPGRRAGGLIAALLALGVACLQPTWPAEVFDSGLGYRLDTALAASPAALERKLHRSPSRLLSLAEGVNATITVRHFQKSVSLLVNGKPDASTGMDMATQVVLGAVPLLNHPRPQEVGIVGWGSGVTAHIASRFPEVERLEVIEIERAVLEASPFFHAVNGAVERDERVRLILDDARSRLLTSRQQYDVLISEPSNPWMAGVSSLFSGDFYDLARRRLKPGGIFAQWLQLYRIDAAAVALVLRTFLASFPEVQLWWSDPYDVILLGSDQPLQTSLARVARAYGRDQRLRLAQAVWGPGDQPEHFFGSFLLDRGALERIVARFPAELMTDDRPILEYRAVRQLFAPVHTHILQLLRAKQEARLTLPPTQGPPPPAGLALAGAATLSRGLPALGLAITEWGMQIESAEPQVRLARAKALQQAGQNQAALKMLQTLPLEHPGYRAEAALLEANILLQQQRSQEALTKLEAMTRFRPIFKTLYTLQANIDLRRFAAAWPLAEQLVGALADQNNLDVHKLQHEVVYQLVRRLVRESRAYERGIKLLTSRTEPGGGEVDRLRALAEAHRGAGNPGQAARIMETLLDFGLFDLETLALGEQVFREAKQEARATACRDQLRRFKPTAAPPALWGD